MLIPIAIAHCLLTWWIANLLLFVDPLWLLEFGHHRTLALWLNAFCTT